MHSYDAMRSIPVKTRPAAPPPPKPLHETQIKGLRIRVIPKAGIFDLSIEAPSGETEIVARCATAGVAERRFEETCDLLRS